MRRARGEGVDVRAGTWVQAGHCAMLHSEKTAILQDAAAGSPGGEASIGSSACRQ